MSAKMYNTGVSCFKDIKPGKPIEVVEMVRAFKEDPHPDKVNCSIGGYLNTDTNEIHLFDAVRKAEQCLANDPSLNHAYLPTLGIPEVNKAAIGLLLGDKHPAIKEDRTICVHSIGGTGPLRIAAELLNRQLGYHTALYSNPTWMNHKDIFIKAGFTNVEPYPYEVNENHQLKLDLLLEKIKQVKEPNKSVLILHASAHNPTGVDPTKEQWRAIKRICYERGILPIFDCAYQGFASGDLNLDAWSLRYFSSQDNCFDDDTKLNGPSFNEGKKMMPGLEILVSQSLGKNMGLYGERIGFLGGVVNDRNVVPNIMTQLSLIIRPMYSNPAGQGAKIVGKILADPILFKVWTEEIRDNVKRLQDVRKQLYALVKVKVPTYDWDGIIMQTGMFYYSKLSYKQGIDLMKRHHVYMLPSSGRINLGAVTHKNAEKVANALADVVMNS